jgi:RNA polymerase sigma factor (sigma-70 family)
MSRPVDATLIAELFDRHAAALGLYAAQWTTHAEDCVQESLLELARQPAAPENPAAWLYRVVRNRALNSSRAERRRATHEQAALAGRGQRRAGDMGRTVTDIELMDALTTVDATAREIVVLRVWGQLAWQEIAEVVGRSKSAAQRDYVAALEQLRNVWESAPSGTPPRETKSCPTN